MPILDILNVFVSILTQAVPLRILDRMATVPMKGLRDPSLHLVVEAADLGSTSTMQLRLWISC